MSNASTNSDLAPLPPCRDCQNVLETVEMSSHGMLRLAECQSCGRQFMVDRDGKMLSAHDAKKVV